MASLGDMIHQITPCMAGTGVSDGKGGTLPTPPQEIATVWAAAKQLKEDRLFRFNELNISEAYEFEIYWEERFLNFPLVKFEGKTLTVHKITDETQEKELLKITAYGSS